MPATMDNNKTSGTDIGGIGEVDYEHGKGGWYEQFVRWIANHRNLKRITDEYETRAIQRNDPHNTKPRLRELIKYEIDRRANIGAMQDDAEALAAATFKTMLSFVAAFVAGAVDVWRGRKKAPKNPLLLITEGAAVGFLINNAFEFWRVSRRYRSGLMGATNTAIQRYQAELKGEKDLTPFNNDNKLQQAAQNDSSHLNTSSQQNISPAIQGVTQTPSYNQLAGTANAESMQALNRKGIPVMPKTLDTANASQAMPQQTSVSPRV